MVELLVTLSLLALLVTVAVPLGELSARRTREMELRGNLREIRRAIDAYKRAVDDGQIEKKLGDSGYPPSLEVLAKGVDDSKSLESGKKIYFLRRIPRDPMCACPDKPPQDTWTLRSYDSPPDSPRAGKDVFDISSSSTQEALDGTHYNTW
jgi:general secretion pathway protein G